MNLLKKMYSAALPAVLTSVLTAFIIFILPQAVFAAGDATEASLYSYTDSGDGYAVFTNYVDGYSMKVPFGMSVDMSYSNVRAALEKSDIKIEIYKQYKGDI